MKLENELKIGFTTSIIGYYRTFAPCLQKQQIHYH